MALTIPASLAPLPLFQPFPIAPSPNNAWNASSFVDVDDRVRGGSSRSHLRVVGKDAQERAASDDDAQRGEAVFYGFLDTTTLGGAGFASQAYPHPFPAPVSNGAHRGLRLVVRQPKSSASESTSETWPGGGKGPVSTFTLVLKMELPAKRPDGRRQSGLTYEYTMRMRPNETEADPSSRKTIAFDPTWEQFEPSYRGRRPGPGEDVPPLRVEEVKEWSIMARSNFGTQSGPFELQMVALFALPREDTDSNRAAAASVNAISGEKDASTTATDEKVSAPAGEYDASAQIAASQEGRPTSQATKLSRRSTAISEVEKGAEASRPASTITSTEAFGLSLFLSSTLLLVGWTLWALVPDAVLRDSLGITWYPSREWAFLLPAWSLVAVLATYAAFLANNVRRTAAAHEMRGVTDSHANLLPLDDADILHGKLAHPLAPIRTPAETATIRIHSDADSAHGEAKGTCTKTKETLKPGPLAADIYDVPPGVMSRWRAFGRI